MVVPPWILLGSAKFELLLFMATAIVNRFVVIVDILLETHVAM